MDGTRRGHEYILLRFDRQYLTRGLERVTNRARLLKSGGRGKFRREREFKGKLGSTPKCSIV